MTHINMMEAAYETIKDDNSFASILCEIIKSSLYRFRKENSHDPAKRIDYGSVTIVCGLCGERNTLCVEVKADDATTFKKTEKDEKKLTIFTARKKVTVSGSRPEKGQGFARTHTNAMPKVR